MINMCSLTVFCFMVYCIHDIEDGTIWSLSISLFVDGVTIVTIVTIVVSIIIMERTKAHDGHYIQYTV